MGTPVHGNDGERLETMLAGQKILALEHCAYIHGMRQSMLEPQEQHTIWRTQYKIMRLRLNAEAQGVDGHCIEWTRTGPLRTLLEHRSVGSAQTPPSLRMVLCSEADLQGPSYCGTWSTDDLLQFVAVADHHLARLFRMPRLRPCVGRD